MSQAKRRDIESECLTAFELVVKDLSHSVTGRGYGAANRFDAGFELIGQQRFQFGDLRVDLDDRIAIVEVESGGGMTNLMKYWPLAEQTEKPIFLFHVFGQGSANDYLSHLHLWDFTWNKMREQLWRVNPPKLFARKYQFKQSQLGELDTIAEDFKTTLSDTFEAVASEIFGYRR